MKKILTIFLAMGLSSCSRGSVPSHRQIDAQVRQHIDRVAASLPPGSSIRRTLEAAPYADGVHEPWMDAMRQAGLREAMFEFSGVWFSGLGFQNAATDRIIYRTMYDGAGSQLTDEGRLAGIETSGLQGLLAKAALAKTRNAIWPFESRLSILGVHCFVDVYLFDDEWVADRWRFTNTPVLGRGFPSEDPLFSAARVGDLLGASHLLETYTFTQQQLNTALIGAAEPPFDNTDVIRLLINSGADVNSTINDGTTVLMKCASSLNVSDVKLLLDLGADAGRKNRSGDTAGSLVRKNIAQSPEYSTVPEYVKELASLLETNY